MQTEGKNCNLSKPQRQAMLLAGCLIVLGMLFSFYLHPLFAVLPMLTGLALLVAGTTGTCYLTAFLTKKQKSKP